MTHQQIQDFLHKHQLCVLSTVNEKGNPESAVVGFSENDKLELMIATSNQSRKYKNMIGHSAVSVVVGWDKWITVQYEGVVRLLSDDELIEYQKNHFAKLPMTEKYKENPDEVYIAITPTYIRYTDCNKDPWDVTELSF